MNEDDALAALLRDGTGRPQGGPPREPKRPAPSRIPALVVAVTCAMLLLTPVFLALTGDPAKVVLGLITGDPLSLFGGAF